MNEDKISLRANRIVGDMGVGAIVDVDNASFIVCATQLWGNSGQQIHLPRLSDRLGRKMAWPPRPDEGEDGHIVLKRFPYSRFCSHSDCRRILINRKDDAATLARDCPYCDAKDSLVPMRFVMACPEGHVSDIPWERWVAHTNAEACLAISEITLEIAENATTGGLESIRVKCLTCGESKSLKNITAPDSMEQIGVCCSGERPWEPGTYDRCGKEVSVLQRGASNLYYPFTASAISLGDSKRAGVEDAKILACPKFGILRRMYNSQPSSGNFIPPRVQTQLTAVALKNGVTEKHVLSLLDAKEIASDIKNAPGAPLNQQEILAEEWEFLTSAGASSFNSPDLVISEPDLPRFQGLMPFSRVLLLHKLREVRAFLGFSRIEPGETQMPHGTTEWLPAVEVFGEGIFLALNLPQLEAWEANLLSQPQQRAKFEILEKRRQTADLHYLPSITPRLIAIHSFAHLLMRQLVHEAGYPSSALRERLYTGADMAGLLIYTADGDSQGSLGGLVRQGRPNRLSDTIVAALDKSRWCSADPVCMETAGQGLGGLNQAACHACSLVPETSCTLSNTLLDRSLVVGNDNLSGLFGQLV